MTKEEIPFPRHMSKLGHPRMVSLRKFRPPSRSRYDVGDELLVHYYDTGPLL